MEVRINIEKDLDTKKHIIEECDRAFIKGITLRNNYNEILNKIDKYAIFISATVSNQFVGYAAMYANDMESETAYITMIGVIPDMQGLKIGKKLLDKCIEVAKVHGMKRIRLEVLKDNIKALMFYKNNQFVFEKKCTNRSNYLIREI